MAQPITAFSLLIADQVALKAFTHTGCRPVRAMRRAQALLALALAKVNARPDGQSGVPVL